MLLQVELVSETPNWLQLLVAGLADPLQVSYWQKEDVMRLKVRKGPSCSWLLSLLSPAAVVVDIW